MSYYPVEALRIFEATLGETKADHAVYAFLSHSAGPNGGDPYQMSVTGTLGDPSLFDWECPAGREADIQRINFVMLDNTVTAAKFGGIPALTNGCKIQVIESGSNEVILDFVDGLTLKSNAHFGWLAGVDIDKGASTDQIVVRWTISKALGGPLRLTEGQKIRMVIQDDLSGIDEFRAMIQGKTKIPHSEGY